MHDGRFATLEQVVEFYNSGVVDNPNLSPPLRNPNGTVRRLNLTTVQKAALVAFLKTLTDANLATNPKFSDPFNYGN
jgi:cytochrome c peroxidase